MTAPITRLPVTQALLDYLRAAGFVVDYGHIPTRTPGPDVKPGTPVATPYLILDPAGHTYDGPPYGDRYASAVWGYQVTVVADRTDLAESVADRFTTALFSRGDDGHFTPPLSIDGQVEWGREVDPSGFRPGATAEGIIALVQRFTVRTQRA